MRVRSAIISGLLAFAATFAARRSDASYLYIEYEANPGATIPGGVFAPELYGWVSNNAGGAGAPVVNDASLGMNAWRVTDSSTQLPNPSYVIALDAQTSADALRDGWLLEAYARYVGDFGGGASMGLTVFLNQRAYHLMFDLNAAGDLQATLHGRVGATALTSGGFGTVAYHRFSLESTGGANATATFDGQPIGAAWPGIAVTTQHENIVQWGNSNQALAGRGTMAFHAVTFEVGPFDNLAADADEDGDVDGVDILRWQRTLGSTTQLAADANRDRVVNAADLVVWRQEFGLKTSATANDAGVPEPSTVALTCIAAALCAAAVMRWAGAAPSQVRSRTAR